MGSFDACVAAFYFYFGQRTHSLFKCLIHIEYILPTPGFDFLCGLSGSVAAAVLLVSNPWHVSSVSVG